MTDWRAGRGIGVEISVARLTSFHECGGLSTIARLPQLLRYASKSGFVAVVFGLIYRATHFYWECGGQDNLSENITFVDLL